MAARSVVAEAKNMAVYAAESGLEGVRSVAGEALGAAAQAATVVVVERAAEALLNTGHQVEKAGPMMAEAARATAAQPFLSKPMPKRKATLRKASPAPRRKASSASPRKASSAQSKRK